jgi:zinc-ribbon domain
MAKQCPNCQQLLDESARFCPICGSQVSQVKPLDSLIEISEEQLPPPLIPGTPISESAILGSEGPRPTAPVSMVKPALLSGIVLGVSSALPFVNCCCWLWVVGAGVLAVYFYRQETQVSMTVEMGAKLGFLTGLLGAVFWELFDLPIAYIYGPESGRHLQDLIENTHNLPPESLKVLDWVISLLHQPFQPAMILFGLLSKLFVCGIFTTLGGVLGVALWRKPKVPNG